MMTRGAAMTILGFCDNSAQAAGMHTPSCEQTKAAFARTVRRYHPDTAMARDKHTYTMETLQMARALLIEEHRQTARQCRLCMGQGSVGQKLGRQKCVACGGTGETK